MFAKLITWILVHVFNYFECVECHKAFKYEDILDRGWAGFCCYDCDEAAFEYAMQAEYEARLDAWQKYEEERAPFREIEMSEQEIEARLNELWDDPDIEVDPVTENEDRISALEERLRGDLLDETVAGRCCEINNPYEEDVDDSVQGHSPNPSVYGEVVDSHTWAMVRSA